MNCANCSDKICYLGKDCTGIKKDIEKYYENEIDRKIMESASKVEALYYMKATRIEEVMLFLKEMSFTHIGMAFCLGLSDEASVIGNILAENNFKISSVCCKVCGIDKKNYNLLQVRPDRFEAICDPIGQAEILNKENTELNIIVGLCIGHDILFTKHSHAPVTTLIVKDRVLSHNPAGAIYSGYYKRKFL